MLGVSSVAWWSALAQYYHLIAPLVPSPDCLLGTSNVPFVKAQYSSHKIISQASPDKLPRPFPPRADSFFVDFKLSPASPGLQRKLLLAINKHRLKSLIAKYPKHSADRARLNSLSDKHSS